MKYDSLKNVDETVEQATAIIGGCGFLVRLFIFTKKNEAKFTSRVPILGEVLDVLSNDLQQPNEQVSKERKEEAAAAILALFKMLQTGIREENK